MALNIKWSNIISFLKTPIRAFKQWKNREKTLSDDKVMITNSDVVEKNIEQIIQSVEDEMSLTLLENQIEVIEKTKSELTKKVRNKYNNQLDQLLMRANARLRKLQGLTFDELDLERILVAQRQLLKAKHTFEVSLTSIDFTGIRKKEQDISNINLKNLNLYPEKISSSIPKEIESELSNILAELLIDESFESIEEIELKEEVKVPKKLRHLGPTHIQKDEIEEIINYFKNNGINCFHHVTSIENIESIENLGLYSWKKLDDKGINYINKLTAGVSQNLDTKKGKQDFVRLSFCRATPMFYAKKHLQTNIIYKISVDCLSDCKFEFANMNATDNEVSIGSSLKFAMENLRFDLFNQYFPNLAEMDRKYFQAEILIKGHIPSKYIISKEKL